MNRNAGLCALALGLILAVAGTAHADVPPANMTCGALKPGDACTTDAAQPGICTAGTCSKLDYSGGSPPKSVSYACVTCEAAAAGSSSSSASGSTSSGGGIGSSGNGASSRGCSMPGTPTEREGSLLLVVALALPLLRRRRAR